MGNETSGFAVLNLSSYTLHFGLSMAATHYYENNVKHGEIFYRWPGAVHYTVFAQTAPELSNKTCVKEITKASLLGVTCAGAAAAAVICLPALPALAGPASSLVVAAEGGALGLAATATAAATANAATDYAIAKQILDALAKVDAADLYAEMKGCYGGGSGTWLVLRGGLQRVNGEVKHEKLRLEEVKPEYILENGKFTAYSYEKFYTSDEAKKHKAAGHSCRRSGCKLLS